MSARCFICGRTEDNHDLPHCFEPGLTCTCGDVFDTHQAMYEHLEVVHLDVACKGCEERGQVIAKLQRRLARKRRQWKRLRASVDASRVLVDLHTIRAGVRELVNCRKVRALGCDCKVGGEGALRVIERLLGGDRPVGTDVPSSATTGATHPVEQHARTLRQGVTGE